jgi:hypothetical protein
MGVIKHIPNKSGTDRQISLFLPGALYSALRHAAIAEDKPYGALIQEILIADERVAKWIGKVDKGAEIRE